MIFAMIGDKKRVFALRSANQLHGRSQCQVHKSRRLCYMLFGHKENLPDFHLKKPSIPDSTGLMEIDKKQQK